MAGQEDEADKSHDPTRQKLEDARKKGEIARSADLTTAAAYGGILLAALAAGAASVETVGSALTVLVDQSSALSREVFTGPAMPSLNQLGLALAAGLAAWFLIPAAASLLAVLAQRGFVVAPEKVKPKLSRINPIQNAKNKFGASGLFEFGKSFLKLVLYSLLLGLFLIYRLSDMAGAIHAEPRIIGALMVRMLVEFMAIVLLIALPIGALDYIWHHFDHLRRNRMSHREVKEEHKRNEGDPYMKQERRQRATKIAMDQMISKVPEADVVVVNPTHYAVALKWSRLPGAAPECIAKGVDHIAHAIREAAHETGIPIRYDPPTARALYATTQIGQEIDPEHYRAVAAAIRFAETMRRKARSVG